MAARGRRSAWAVLRGELAELVLPQRCVACRRFGSALHAECLAELPRADGVRCERCWAPLQGRTRGEVCERCQQAPPLIEARRAAFRFEGAARLAILEAKFRGVTALLVPLAEAAAAVVEASWGVEAVVSVPLHPSRRRARGFDQGALIAKTVGECLEVPVRADLIRRVRKTRAQASLGRAGRARNVEGAFAARSGALRIGGAGGALDVPRAAGEGVAGLVPQRVLLVDDVATTGATLAAAAEALRAAGVAHCFGLTLASED